MTRREHRIGRKGNELPRAIRAVLANAAKQRNFIGAMSLAMSVTIHAQEAPPLPTPCIAGACGANVTSFSGGAATATITGNTLNVTQTQNSATLHWQNFNIAAGNVVNFQQPTNTSVALNRIYQSDPSRILGSLNANGRVYLLNQNGFVFGQNSRINVGGLIASSLNLTQEAVDNGLARAIDAGQPAFSRFIEGNGNPVVTGGIELQRGASVSTSDGGQVLMFAPEIVNRGTITTPGGQTILAAGSSVYLQQSGNADLRGLLVEVGLGGGEVTNGDTGLNATITDPAQIVGQIIAERGNVTLAGLAVNQRGRVSATTTVKENGSIRLQAREGGGVAAGNPVLSTATSTGGTLIVGQGSITDVSLAVPPVNTAAETAVDTTVQLRSQIDLQGRSVQILSNAQVVATGGEIEVLARAAGTPNNPPVSGTQDDGSRIYLAQGATLDVSGANIELAMERNVVTAELRGDELANSPVQRNGALRGETVYVDSRASGTRENGEAWYGTPIGDVRGQIALVERDVTERNLIGGTVTLQSQGDTILAAGSTINLSGGSITYRDGYINASMLLGSDGRAYNMADADPNRTYTAIVSNPVSIVHSRWGVTETFVGGGGRGNFESGYVEGKDAGTLNMTTPIAILDGAIAANVVTGRYQRNLAGELVAGHRPYNQLPVGGTFTFGRAPTTNNIDLVGSDIVFGGGLVLPTLRTGVAPLDMPFDPTRHALPASLSTTRMRSELFGEDRIARAQLFSNGTVELPSNVTLSLPGQGQLSVTAGHVTLAGDVIAPSGEITISAQLTETTRVGSIGIDVAGTSQLNVSGRWVNDSLSLNASGDLLAPLLIRGGDVTLSSNLGSLLLASGSVIDVSGGAWARSNGRVTAGAAGNITLNAVGNLTALAGQSVVLQQNADLRAFGFDNGGTLSISAPEICIAADSACGTDVESTLRFSPESLLAGGFSDITLTSNERGLLVESGAVIDLQQRNLWLSAGAFGAVSGTDIRALSSVITLPDYLRAASNLHLNTAAASSTDSDNASRPYTNANFAAAPNLVVESGAVISADPGATLSLESNTRMLVDGALTARAGNINLTLNNDLDISETLRTQGIWLGSNARLDASGTVVLQPNELGLREGVVLDGGTINLGAERGAVIANYGSAIDASGTNAILDIRSAGTATSATTPTLIASNGGTLAVTAADAIVLSGNLSAHAGVGSAFASGGELRIEMDAQSRKGSNSPNFLPPFESRSILVSDSLSPVSIAPLTALPDVFANRALVSADAVEASGFSDVSLSANSLEGQVVDLGPVLVARGSIEFVDNVDLDLSRSLILDAARITGNGNVGISAAYVALGHSDSTHQETTAPVVNTGGAFTVSGAFVEVVGNSSIDGFNSVNLASTGDLRLRGVQQSETRTVIGSLLTNADLTLSADQVYATTLSNFRVAIDNNVNGVLRIESTGQARDTVLSAASHLTLAAPTIEQAGVLRAPFGTIELNADTLRLEQGSLTSTSAENAIIPFGSIQAGTDWVYSLPGQTLVVGDTLPTPEQNIALNGNRIAVDNGAVIDVSGGGDLLAYEFQPGTTGKDDVLSIAERPGRFAIVPALNVSRAPYDPQESRGSSLAVGDTIHISASVAGLPAGDYVLLPARYALLQGAYVVEAASGYTDLQPGTVVQQLNGSNVVSGYRFTADTSFADARNSGFLVTSGAQLAQEARYTTALASSFFAEQAVRNDTAVPRLPQDAGVLSMAAISQLNIDGTLRALARDGGRGAAVDISAQNLLISDSASGTAGQVVVGASDLSALGAESILLGGRRSSSNAGVVINTASDNVTIDAGATLTVAELILSANDTVRVGAGASLTASGDVPVTDSYVVNGDGALLRLAAGEQATITRNNEVGARGSLILEQGATLTANGGALALDASLDTQSAATLAMNAGSLSLGASRINLGVAPQSASGLTLDAARLNALSLNELVLASRSTIDLYGNVVLNVNDVALDGAGVRAQSSGNGSISAVRSIGLSNRDGRTGVDAATSSGTLALNASEIIVGEGTQRITGYQSVSLNATSQVRGENTGGLSVAGDLNVVAPVILVARAADTTLTTTGNLSVSAPTSGSAAPQQAELGGSINLSGAAVTLATRVEAAAGSVAITATTGDVTLASGSIIDVAGRERNFDGAIVAAPAGDVSLVSSLGNVTAQLGSTIDVSSAADGEAGAIDIAATAGTVTLAGQLLGEANASRNSGRVSVDARNLGNVSALNTTFNAGGFNAERELRQRGVGDVTLAASDTLRAERVGLTADQGSIVINGGVDASAGNGGDVVLSASNSVIVNGSIAANATTTNGDGGELDLRADTGGVRINSGARIDLSAGAQSDEGGELRMRVRRTALTDADVTNDVVLAGSINGVEQTTLEAFSRYTDADGVITEADTRAVDGNVMFAEARDFINNSGAAITASLNRTGDASFRLLPGIEIQSSGDLSLGLTTDPVSFAGWDLSTWRFGTNAVPGVLTLRANGNLTINRSLSDGFTGLTGNATAAAFRLTATDDSWSYRLIAGADRTSANLLTVTNNGGYFSIAPGIAPANNTNPGTYRMVRTGNGFIDVAAAGDFILGNQQSMLYTAGVASTVGFSPGNASTGLGNRLYPINGGDISIFARGDISGGRSRQFVTDWLWRTGRSVDENPTGFATAWTVNFVRFQQDVAALGGGDVDVRAGGSIRGFSASIPSIGLQVGGVQAQDSRVNIVGGGNLSVRAGANIEGGSYFVGLGRGELSAARSIASLPLSDGGTAFYPLLGLGDGSWNLKARDSVGIEAIVNPTMLPQGRSQPGLVSAANQSWFSTYSATSAVDLLATSGNVIFSNNASELGRALTQLGNSSASGLSDDEKYLLQLYSPSLVAVSMSGDLLLSGDMSLFPAQGATLDLFANNSIARSGIGPLILQQLDADPVFLPNVNSPRSSDARIKEVITGLTAALEPSSNAHPVLPVHSGDNSITHMVARTGDVDFEQFVTTGGISISDTSRIILSTPIRMVAGGDVVDLPLFIQHDNAARVSSIVAGGEVRYTVARSANGDILNNAGREIAVDGPGALLIAAGGDVDLQTSEGIRSRGNLLNPNLADTGAGISVIAGLQGRAPNYDAFAAEYVVGSDTYDSALSDYMTQLTGTEPADRQAALTWFASLDQQHQSVLLHQLLVSELRASAEIAASSDPVKHGDYSRGFAAMEMMFPGSTANTAAGETNPYDGDIALYFSRIYTQDGGDITLLTPGGGVNVGLAAPPTSFGINKDADRLGIVTQRGGNIGIAMDQDLLVNESRMFAINDSDIVVWSSSGDIDAGRGAKTAISAPEAVITYDRDGRPSIVYSAALAGSGIQARTSTAEFRRGAVVLAAPRGVVNAGDAGIVAGDLTIAATAVLGADNIDVGGVSVGVPVDTGGLGASLSGVSAAASSASNSATMALDEKDAKQDAASVSDAALSWLEVFVVGLGEEGCKQDDIECLKRQK